MRRREYHPSAKKGQLSHPNLRANPNAEHMCARIKFHTCVDSVYTKTQCKSVKRVLKLYDMTECLKIVT
jgi:hypothetical protein